MIAWLTIVFRGYLPEGANNAMTFCNSFYTRVYAYLALLTDVYPPVGEEKSKGGGPAAAPAAAADAAGALGNWQGKGGQG